MKRSGMKRDKTEGRPRGTVRDYLVFSTIKRAFYQMGLLTNGIYLAFMLSHEYTFIYNWVTVKSVSG